MIYLKEKVKVKSLSCVQLFVTPWMVAYQAPLAMEFSRQEYWRGLLFPTLGIFPTQGLNQYFLGFLHLRHWQVDSLPLCNPAIVITVSLDNLGLPTGLYEHN